MTDQPPEGSGHPASRPNGLDYSDSVASFDELSKENFSGATPGGALTRARELVSYKALAGVFVYRLGRGLLKAERGVRFPYALPISVLSNDTNVISHFSIFQKRKVRITPSKNL